MIKNWKKITLVLVSSSTMLSCIKDPVEEPIIPTTPAALQSALADGWGHADPATMQPNDFLFQETEQKIETDPNPFYVLQEGITISKKDETSTDYIYTFLYQTRVIKRDQESPAATREDHRTVAKPNASAATMVTSSDPMNFIKPLQRNTIKAMAEDYQMTLGFEKLYSLAYACTKSAALDKYCKDQLKVESCEIECSNLKSTEQTVPAPDLIKAQDNCAGYENCTLHTKKISFDWTIALKNGQTIEKQKVNYSVILSPDLPFFSRMTEYCYRQLVTVQNQKLLVNTCTKLKNFKKGS
ncbi:MAG: hypothetical protein ACXVCY_14680 [Pseudobdellovibrionaceae bacterium]